MISMITTILDVEQRYMKGFSNRDELTDKIKKIKTDFEMKFVSKQMKDCRFYKLGIILLLERIKQRLIFEDKLVDVVENVKLSFFSKLKELLEFGEEETCNETYNDIAEIEQHQHSKKIIRRANYPHKVTKILKKWLEDNVNHPYPSEIQKTLFCEKTGLDISQINNWFINARRRILPQLKKEDKTK